MAKRTKTNRIFTIVLVVLLGIGVITAGVFIFKPKESKRIHPSFQVGSIDNNGKYVDSDDSIYSDKFECQGLKIEPNFSTNVKFNVYYYRFDDSFIKADTNETDKYEAPNDETYRYARIVITPNKTDKNSKIRFWNVSGIANDIKIFVNTDQGELKNLAEVAENGKWSDGTGALTSNWYKLEKIDLTGIEELAFVFESGLDKVSTVINYSFNEDGSNPLTFENNANVESSNSSTIVKLKNLTEKTAIYISVHEDVSLKIYKYN